MSTQKDIIGAMKQQTSGPSRRALIASGVATSTAAIRYDRSTSGPAVRCAQIPVIPATAYEWAKSTRCVRTGDGMRSSMLWQWFSRQLWHTVVCAPVIN